MHFRGREKLTIDGKGRVSVPARFRDVLAENYTARLASKLVIVPWFEPCLRVFPVALWDEKQRSFDEAFGADDIFGVDEGESDFRRFVYGSALDTTVDGSGRILIPADLREHAGLDRDVYWVGLGPVLELWQPERFRERLSGQRAAQVRSHLSARRPIAEDPTTGN